MLHSIGKILLTISYYQHTLVNKKTRTKGCTHKRLHARGLSVQVLCVQVLLIGWHNSCETKKKISFLVEKVNNYDDIESQTELCF